MLIFAIIFGSLAGLALLIFLIYLLFLVRPAAKQPPSSALCASFAHRGLHGRGVPENSLAAFEAAATRGYAVELDVQLSSDGEVMVFHDYDLSRMTGSPKKLSELTAKELCALCLADTDERIPTFSEVLSLIGGRVPLLIELKGESFDTSLCEKVAALLDGYGGEYCIESFNPLLISAMRKCLPSAYYGLLYTNVCRERREYSVKNIAVSCMALNFLAKPNFIAYSKDDRSSLPTRLSTRLYRAPRYVWTVRGDEELTTALKRGECPIFESCESKF